jgi:transposase
MLLADRGYDADWIRELAMKKGAWANIPPKSNRSDPICFSPYLYRARNQVERFFNKIKHCRRVATRYDRLAANYLAFVQLASIRLWLRLNESEMITKFSAVLDFPIEARASNRRFALPTDPGSAGNRRAAQSALFAVTTLESGIFGDLAGVPTISVAFVREESADAAQESSLSLGAPPKLCDPMRPPRA